MVLHARVVGITMEGLDDRVDAAADGARSFFNNARFRAYARQMVGITAEASVDRIRDSEKMTLEPDIETPVPLLDMDRFERNIESLRSAYQSAVPYPHIVIDDFLEPASGGSRHG